MQTNTQNVQLRVLKADAGHKLRRKDAADPIHFSEVVYLGVNDSAENYIEVPQAEVDAYHARQEAEARTEAEAAESGKEANKE